MFQKTTIIIAAAFICFSTTAAADYAKTGFQRTGTLDAVHLDQQTIVINDIAYSLSDNFVVHSKSTYSVPATRLVPGILIGYKMAGRSRLITEIWLLPPNYNTQERR